MFTKFLKFQNVHKTCSHHANLCWNLLSQKNQTLMNDWGNSIKMSMKKNSNFNVENFVVMFIYWGTIIHTSSKNTDK
jgi:hypothetical protein